MSAGVGDTIDIGDVVRASGVPVSTLHVWERRGLIAPVGRAGLRRQYAADVLDRIAIIVLGQRSGFSLGELAHLLDPAGFAEGRSALAHKLEELREQRRQLDLAIGGLEHALECQHPIPMECPHFRASLHDVLPVERT